MTTGGVQSDRTKDYGFLCCKSFRHLSTNLNQSSCEVRIWTADLRPHSSERG